MAMAHRSVWSHLPDDLAAGILARLPAVSILSARCVSRRWRSLLSSPSFPALWSAASSSPRRDILFLVYRSARHAAAYDPRSARWSSFPLFDLCALDPSSALPLASAAGLLCFRDRGDAADHPTLTVCNPLSAARRVLPRIPHIQFIDIVGMSSHPTSSSYSILVTGTTGTTSASASVTVVFDSCSGLWEHHCTSDQEFLQSFYEVRAVWHDNAFYCLATLDHFLISYDIHKRTWVDLNVSLPLPIPFLRRPSLLVSGGKLLLTGKHVEGSVSKSIRVWELERSGDGLRWVLVDTMPRRLFEAMHHHHVSSIIRCQGHDELVCFSATWGANSVMYDVLDRKWELLPENREDGLNHPQWTGRSNLLGLPYEPSLSARV